MEREELKQGTVETQEQAKHPPQNGKWDAYSIFQVIAYTIISLAMLGFFIYLCVQGS